MLPAIEEEPFLHGSRDNEESSDSDTVNEKPIDTSSRRRQERKTSLLLSHCAVILATTIFWGVYFFLVSKLGVSPSVIRETHNSTLFAERNYYHCGETIEEAKSRGCSYDISTNHYIPTRCIDQVAIEEYRKDGSWYGYADANHTELLSISEMGSRPMYYTNRRDHVIHCALLWRRQFRALKSRRQYMDSLAVDEEHMIHCSKFLIEMTEYGPDFTKIPIEVYVGYAGCHVRE